MNLHLACLSLLCLPSASCKAQEMIDNPGWGCLEKMLWFVTLILAAPVNNLLEAQGGRGAGWAALRSAPGALPQACRYLGYKIPTVDTREAQQ